jgi:hypothetical protein
LSARRLASPDALSAFQHAALGFARRLLSFSWCREKLKC